MSNSPATTPPRQAAVLFILVTVLLDMLSFGIIIPVLPKLVEEFFSGDTAQAAVLYGLMGTAWAFMQFFCSPIQGALSDRFGRRPVVLLSNLGLGLDYIVMALAPNLAWLALADVKGINDAEVTRIVAGRPYRSLADFWHRAAVSRPVVERLVLAGAFDSVYGIGSGLSGVVPGRRRGRHAGVTRRDLLLQTADLGRWHAMPTAAARQDRPLDVQLALDWDDGVADVRASGLPEMTDAERVRAELDVLGLDASRHVVDFYTGLLDALTVVRARDLLGRRSRSEVLVAGVKVATQTPPVRSGRRVVFVTLDDATGPVDATFFEDAQGPYAATLFHSWLLLVRGEVRRTGPRGVSLRATGCWDLAELYAVWQAGGTSAVLDVMAVTPEGFGAEATDDAVSDRAVSDEAVAGAADSRSTRPVMVRPDGEGGSRAGGMGRRRVLVHPSGFRQSPYADVRPPGEDVKRGAPPRKLWHSSPGSAGR